MNIIVKTISERNDIMRKSAAYRLRQDRIMTFLRSAFAGVGALFVSVLLFSFVITRIDVPDGVIRLLSSVALCAGCYAASYTCAKHRRKNGLLTGLACGAFTFAVIFLLSLIIFRGVTGGGGFFSKLLMILSCSAIGGIVGVNSNTLKQPK